MTEDSARTTANVVMAAAARGAAVIVFRNPTLPRLFWERARKYATGPLPAVLAMTVRDAWNESGRSPRTAAR